jgi:hypothetical protein
VLLHSPRKRIQVLKRGGSAGKFCINGERTDRETPPDQVGCPVVVGEGRTFLKREVWHLGGLDNERVQEGKERERQP